MDEHTPLSHQARETDKASESVGETPGDNKVGGESVASSKSDVKYPPTLASAPLSPSEERTWAMIAHLSILANLVTGFLGPVCALVIYFMYKDRSRYIAYHSIQSFMFQLIAWIGGGAIVTVTWIITGLLSVIIIGICLIPLAIIISIIPIAVIVYGVIGGIQCNQGKDFKYWLIGDWMRSVLTN